MSVESQMKRWHVQYNEKVEWEIGREIPSPPSLEERVRIFIPMIKEENIFKSKNDLAPL